MVFQELWEHKQITLRGRGILLIIASLFASVLIISCKAQESNNRSLPGNDSVMLNHSSNTSPYPVTIKQADNSTIQVLGKGNRENPYAETIDGFTIMKNRSNIYEYAILGANGVLELSGVKANDPDERTAKEIDFLRTNEKHLRN